MGAWDVGTFDNDTACDWTYGLEEHSDTSLVEAALDAILSTGSDYLDADVACEGLAAAEVVARLRGNWGARNAYTETVDQWVDAHPSTPPDDLVGRAVSAIDRVLSEPSELLELWSESQDLAGWQASVADLRARVRG